MSTFPRSIPPSGDPRRDLDAIREAIDRPALRATISLGAEASNVIPVTIQAVNRYKRPYRGAVRVNFWAATTQWAGPAGTQTFSIVKGTSVFNYTANRHIMLLTATDGMAIVNITVSGAGTRYLYADVGGAIEGVPAVWI